MSISDGFKQYQEEQNRKAAEKEQTSIISALEAEKELNEWFEHFLAKKYPDEVFWDDIAWDARTHDRFPAKGFKVAGFPLYLRPAGIGYYDLYGPAIGSDGCDLLETLTAESTSPDMYHAIAIYCNRYNDPERI